MLVSDDRARGCADHRAIAAGWIQIQSVFTSRVVTDWYHEQIAAPVRDVDSRRVLSEVAVSGPVRVTDVANAIGMSLSSASRVVQRLVVDGLVRRMASETDRRAILLEVTDAGRDAFDRLHDTDLALLRRNLEKFPAVDVATFADLIGRFAHEISSWHDELVQGQH